MVQVFIGYDDSMLKDYYVANKSLIEHATVPVSITPISLKSLGKLYTRDVDPKASSQFTYSRFFAPYLLDYKGWSIFVDSDVVFLDDIKNLYELRDDKYSVQVVKHSHVPNTLTKMGGISQSDYPRKGWSGVIMFNNDKCKVLTPDFVNTASGATLHRFLWLDDNEIGELPFRWNFLVGEYEMISPNDISLLHYTLGTPMYKDYRDSDYSSIWKKHEED